MLLAGERRWESGYFCWDNLHKVTLVETMHVHMPAGTVTEDNAGGAAGDRLYHWRRIAIELASKVIGRVAWIGVEIEGTRFKRIR